MGKKKPVSRPAFCNVLKPMGGLVPDYDAGQGAIGGREPPRQSTMNTGPHYWFLNPKEFFSPVHRPRQARIRKPRAGVFPTTSREHHFYDAPVKLLAEPIS